MHICKIKKNDDDNDDDDNLCVYVQRIDILIMKNMYCVDNIF